MRRVAVALTQNDLCFDLQLTVRSEKVTLTAFDLFKMINSFACKVTGICWQCLNRIVC